MQTKAKCTKCNRIFIRYDYGKTRIRFRRWGKGGRGNPYSPTPHASIKDSCIFCRGSVEVL